MKSWKGEKCYAQLREALGLPEKASPFPWQNRLLKNFFGGQIPNAIDIPTSLGKTAVIAIWLVARAAGAPIPRRLVYVVDRRDRAVADQATEVAERLCDFVERDTECKRLLGPDRSLLLAYRHSSRAIRRQKGLAGKSSISGNATAAGEVGVDLDADHAVCDLVAWEMMVQRFGHVNRHGNGDATIVIIPEAAETEKEKVHASTTIL